jgi:hypothetical protein
VNIRNALLTMALVSTPLPSLAAENYLTERNGATSCGQWIEARKNAETDAVGLLLSVWVSGFVSGAAFTGTELKYIDPAARADWIDNYCKERPQNDIATAAEQLVIELRK